MNLTSRKNSDFKKTNMYEPDDSEVESIHSFDLNHSQGSNQQNQIAEYA